MADLPSGQPSIAEGRIALHLGWSHAGRAADDLIRKAVAWTWRVKLALSTERDLFTLSEAADRMAQGFAPDRGRGRRPRGTAARAVSA